jgi:hypothetical protein
MEHVLDKQWLAATARQVGFIQRATSRVEGDDFVKLLTTEVIALPAISLAGMCDVLRRINPKADMSPQALSERINSKGAVDYLKEVLRFAVEENLRMSWERISPQLLAPFKRVFLEDSTGMSLHEKLAGKFKGTGGNASKAALKINFIFDLKRHAIHELSATGGNVPDQSRAAHVVEQLEKGDLVIRDLGYFSIKSLVAIDTMEAFYLSRLLKGVGIYLCPGPSSAAINIVEYLNKEFAHQDMMDLDIHMGQEKHPCRLVVYRAPEAVVNERIRKANASAKKKGRQLSDAHKQWLRFTLFVTNVSRDTWLPDVVGTIYRIRWQIELTFKSWKSLCHIHVLKGQRSERIECLIYGRLIAIVLITMIYGFCNWYCDNQIQREACLHKVVEWLKRRERLSKAVLSCEFDILLQDLIHDLPKMLCKQKRRRKTTLELIEAQVPYNDSFSNENNKIAA